MAQALTCSQVWLSVRQAAALLEYADPRTLRRDIRLYPDKYVTQRKPGAGAEYEILLSSLPEEARLRYTGESSRSTALVTQAEAEADLSLYHQAPQFAKRTADKYKTVLTLSQGLKGAALQAFIARWNAQYPEQHTSYQRIMAARNAYASEGMPALLSRHGHGAGDTSVREEWWEFYKERALRESAPPLKACWEETFGFALEAHPGLTKADFPSYKAFERLLKRRIGESALYRARAGYSKWKRKYASSIERNYDEIQPGELWVSDHVQLDVMVSQPNGRTCRPWLTVWMDVKSAKMLGWCFHAEAPNSDHVFQAFYNAALKFGVPRHVYLDNGKDYRARDLSGGRVNHSVEVDPRRAMSLFSVLDIEVHFALPYNAQAKTVERRFLELKNRFGRLMVGFTGGNVVEKPEKLANEIRLGKIMTLAQVEPLVETYLEHVYNVRASNGKVLKGQSPDAYYAAHAPTPRMFSADALKLFCFRVSTGRDGQGIKIGPNGVPDTSLGLMYWAEWMVQIKGTYVYMHRDPKAYETAWIFNAETRAYLGIAPLSGASHMIARGNVQKADLQAKMAEKRREEKEIESFQTARFKVTPEQTMKYLSAGVKALSGATPVSAAPAGTPVEVTSMDHVIAEEKRNQAKGRADFSTAAAPVPAPKKEIHLLPFQAREAAAQEEKLAGT